MSNRFIVESRSRRLVLSGLLRAPEGQPPEEAPGLGPRIALVTEEGIDERGAVFTDQRGVQGLSDVVMDEAADGSAVPRPRRCPTDGARRRPR